MIYRFAMVTILHILQLFANSRKYYVIKEIKKNRVGNLDI